VGLTVGHAIAARSVLAAMERLMADPANAERVAGSLHGLGAEGSNTYLPSTGVNGQVVVPAGGQLKVPTLR